MPVYAVRDVETNDVRLVEASRPETALKHVVTPRYAVTLATPADGVDAGRAGRSIEVAGAEPEPATLAQPPIVAEEQQPQDTPFDKWANGFGEDDPNASPVD